LMPRRAACALVVLLAAFSAGTAADLSVAPAGQLSKELYTYLTSAAERHWTDRKEKVAALSSPGEVRDRQKYIRRWILDAIGGFPEKTPLNPRITGGFTRDGYRVEHLVFESQPKLYVTANVYIPTDVKPPFPAVIGVAGHSATGKAIDTYQHAWIGMVKRGFLVVAFDPPGQGERSEYFDPEKKESTAGIGVREHNMAGTQCLLTGTTFARYETWDGIRAFDYLLTRSDVDPKRIAVAGNSGGGTQSAYLAVLEPRLAASVISCYMTNWEQLWNNPGPQDAEQNFPGFLRAGLNFGDFMIAFVPKPITMLTGIRDYFPIEGARATHAEVKRVFDIMDAGVHAGYFEYDDEHGWHKPRREATYRWLMKWLQGKDDAGTEPPIQPEPESNLNVTPTGQVSTSFGGETVRSLNLQLAEKIFPERRAASVTDANKLRAMIAQSLHLSKRSGVPASSQENSGSDSNARWTKFLLETEPGIRVPVVLFTPEGEGKRPAMLYVNAAGKSADMAAIHKLVQKGNVVVAVDPRGWGESAPEKRSRGYSPDWQLAQRAMLIGKPLVGMQVFDVLRVFDYVVSRPEIDAAQISITGVGHGGVVALYAGALEPRIASVTSQNAVASYMTVARADTHSEMIGIVVPGVLRNFDLPDVAAAISPRPLQIVSARDANG
ncbi:MAG: alpha/beta hydrolase family protein, partial [Bryobacteraceae bacterium]